MKEDSKKWFLISLVLIGVLLTWIMGEFFTFLGNYFSLHIKPILGIFPAYYALSAALNLALVIYIMRQGSIETFAAETVTEVKKVSWPTTSDTSKSTGVVLVVVVICGVILWVYDSILTWALKIILGSES